MRSRNCSSPHLASSCWIDSFPLALLRSSFTESILVFAYRSTACQCLQHLYLTHTQPIPLSPLFSTNNVVDSISSCPRPRHCCVVARSVERGWYVPFIGSCSLGSDSPRAPVKRSDHEVEYKYKGYEKPYEKPYKPEYDYKPEHDTYKYEYDYYPTTTYEYKPEKTHGWDYKYKYDDKYQPKYLCQLPPKDAPWYGDYYKWACTSDPRLILVSLLNLHL